jgi:hypothetical protein
MKMSASTRPLTMSFMSQTRSRFLLSAFAAILMLSGVAVLILTDSPVAGPVLSDPRPDTPTVTPIDRPLLPIKMPGVTWVPEMLVVTLSPGETKTVTVTATSDGSVPATTVKIPLELQPYLTVSPTQLSAFQGVSSQTLDLTFAFPAGTDYQEVTGTLVLKGPKIIVAGPLPIELGLWQRFGNELYRVSTLLPPGFQEALSGEVPQPLAKDEGRTLGIFRSFPSSDSGLGLPVEGCDIRIGVEDNATNLTLMDWFSIRSYHSPSDEIAEIEVGGITALKRRGVSEVFEDPFAVVFIPHGSVVFYIAYEGHGDAGILGQCEADFDVVVSSFFINE